VSAQHLSLIGLSDSSSSSSCCGRCSCCSNCSILHVVQNESSVIQDNSLQRQLSIDLSAISSPSDLITSLQLFNIDVVEFARENVGLFLTVSVYDVSFSSSS